MAYKPPTAVVTRQQAFLNLVTSADPDFSRSKFWAPEYLTAQRALMANPYNRGSFNRLGNAYPVGSQYGQPDPLVIAGLAPTVGSAVPGLYQAVPDGKGWA